MKNVDNSLKNAKQEIDRLSKTSMTEAGPDSASNTTLGGKPVNREELVDAVNQIFSLFRVNYHNQYYAAFNDSETLNQAKRLWLNAIENYDASTVLQSAKQSIENSEYLPSLNHFLSHCDRLQFHLPDSHDAYVEACQAADNIAGHAWSHLAVYHAGKATGWHFLRSQPEKQVFPLFKAQYEKQKAHLREGILLSPVSLNAIEEIPAQPLPAEEQKVRLAKLKAELNL